LLRYWLKISLGINPYPIEEPIRQPELPPQPIEETKPVLVTSSPIEEPRTQPVPEYGPSPVISDPIKETNPINTVLEENSSAIRDTASVVGKAAFFVGGAILATSLLSSTAPFWITGGAVTAGVIGLSTLGLFGSSKGDESL
jgi:hypothetical protein